MQIQPPDNATATSYGGKACKKWSRSYVLIRCVNIGLVRIMIDVWAYKTLVRREVWVSDPFLTGMFSNFAQIFQKGAF